MRKLLPHLEKIPFPALHRRTVKTLQVNLGYYCNQSCLHCHVNAGPTRKEMMDEATADEVVDFIRREGIECVDLTGGAPELNANFRSLVVNARALGAQVIDRCNLTVLLLEGQEDLAAFLAQQGVEIYASLPCYSEGSTDAQRGSGVFSQSIRALQRLNQHGYGIQPELPLVLVHNPQGTDLPPGQEELEKHYRRHLRDQHGIEFSRLVTIANMPIARFGSALLSKGKLEGYLQTLRDKHNEANLDKVMCRDLISIDWQGYVYDCDFNQMLGIHCRDALGERIHIKEIAASRWENRPICVAGHCYGCTAGHGSSCGGSLEAESEAFAEATLPPAVEHPLQRIVRH